MPLLVFISITPNAALAPYIEVDAASFSTEMLSISSEFTNEMSLTTTLSTRIRGEPPSVALSDPIPLMFMAGALFMAPLEKVTVSPGTAPCSPLAGSVNGLLSIVRATFTVVTAPVRFSFFWEPKPTTTSSSRRMLSSLRVTSMISLPFTGIFSDCIPTRENSSTPLSGAIMV